MEHSSFKHREHQSVEGRMPFNAILIGAPGVGKGTQCDILKSKVDYAHVSTGDLIRAEIRNQTEIGLSIQSITEKGGLVPDEIINQMLCNHINSLPINQSWMIDGFPRTLAQAQFLKDSGLQITHIIELAGDEAEITKRLSGRLFDPLTGSTYHKINNPPPADVAGRCITRKDDQPAVIAQRFQIFRDSAEAIRTLFSDLEVIIDAKGKSIQEIASQIEKILL
ncbi:Adenylate_kinase 1 [Hexamita inflata]|uniref:Adenylate kinase 1 n=1 Tax=Hexamita inflata TaxID=28002 RepID=A0AA86NNX6_9EUKA|nr:Adenylate kinase 1 [Hexamita inflata]CAI9923447.1 Adenylate kinase 1 [Hexamita inflata]